MNEIPGFTSDIELKILQILSSNVPENGSILEVGSFLGRSTLSLFNGKKTSVSLDIVETFQVDKQYSPFSNFFYINGNKLMFENAKKIAQENQSWRKSFDYCLGSSVIKNINIFEGSSQDFLINKNYDLVFIDADHSLDSVTHDIKKFSNASTLIVGDDFTKNFPNVALSVCFQRNKRSVVVLKNTKFYVILPYKDINNWKNIIQHFI